MKLLKEIKVRHIFRTPSSEVKTWGVIFEEQFFVDGKLLGSNFEKISIYSDRELSVGDELTLEIYAAAAYAKLVHKKGA